jgi:hypothetical protein
MYCLNKIHKANVKDLNHNSASNKHCGNKVISVTYANQWKLTCDCKLYKIIVLYNLYNTDQKCAKIHAVTVVYMCTALT